MHRFFVPPEWLQHERISLTGSLAHQLTHVLRLRPGDEIVLLDDSGWAYQVELESVAPALAVARLVAKSWPDTEPRLRLVLYQALPKGRKLDWVLQKGTELGVTTFVPILAERCVTRTAYRPDGPRMARWRRIVREAAEQSGRTRIPKVSDIRVFAETCETKGDEALSLMACAREDAIPFGYLLRTMTDSPPEEVGLYVGPEGGFSGDEVQLAIRAGILPVSLGPRVLRTETAALVALSAILYALGELDRRLPRS